MEAANGTCLPCDGYYDAQTRACLDCPAGSNMYKKIVSGKCECPANMPILARGTCVFCPVPNSYVDEKLGICQSCPQGTHAIPEMNQCVCP